MWTVEGFDDSEKTFRPSGHASGIWCWSAEVDGTCSGRRTFHGRW